MQTLTTPVINQGDAESKRSEIREYYRTTWDMYENLYSTIADDAYYLRPDALRHPLIFYFGHTATFYANKLMVSKITNERINPKIESMLAIGVDEMSWDDLDETNYDWPTVAEVKNYRNKVRAMVENLIDTLPLSLPINWEDPFWIIMMGIEHERIHFETSSVLIRQLSIEKVKAHKDWAIYDKSGIAPENTLIDIKSDEVKQGRSQPSSTYAWDNEYGEVTTQVKEFKASKFLVSNQEYLVFVEDAGYQTERHWTEEGWNWLQYKKVIHPFFWLKNKNGQQYKYRSMLEEINMPWDWPVDVNYLEAKHFVTGLVKNNQSRFDYQPKQNGTEWQIAILNTIMPIV